MAHDVELGLEFGDPAPCLAKFRRFGSRDPIELTAVDTVLPHPLRQRDRMDVEIMSDLLLRFALARNSAGYALGMLFSLSERPSLSHHDWNPSGGAGQDVTYPCSRPVDVRQCCGAGPGYSLILLSASIVRRSSRYDNAASSSASSAMCDLTALRRRASSRMTSERATDNPDCSARHSAACRARAVRRFPPSDGLSMIWTDSSSPSGVQPSGAFSKSGPNAHARHHVRRRTFRGRPSNRSSERPGKRQGPTSGTTTSVRNDHTPSSAASAGTMSMSWRSIDPHGRSKFCVDVPRGFG
ncbi:hypothetical protein NODU109028_19700 [Nocardioides dubius]